MAHTQHARDWEDGRQEPTLAEAEEELRAAVIRTLSSPTERSARFLHEESLKELYGRTLPDGALVPQLKTVGMNPDLAMATAISMPMLTITMTMAPIGAAIRPPARPNGVMAKA